MTNQTATIKTPWEMFPGSQPSDSFWRQEGEAWALNVWLPYWSKLSKEERKQCLIATSAPEGWLQFYDEEFQAFLKAQDGPGGWMLRNNLVPGAEELPGYTSVNAEGPEAKSWGLYVLMGVTVALSAFLAIHYL